MGLPGVLTSTNMRSVWSHLVDLWPLMHDLHATFLPVSSSSNMMLVVEVCSLYTAVSMRADCLVVVVRDSGGGECVLYVWDV